MKFMLIRIAAVALVLFSVLGCVACTDGGADTDTTVAGTTQNAPADTTATPELNDTTVPDTTVASPDTTTLPITDTESVINLNSSTKGIKILGVRNLASLNNINADWSCSGIEFNANCKGDVTFSVSASANCYYRVYVDGKECLNGTTPYFTVGVSATDIKVTVDEGLHNFVLMKVTGYTIARSQILSVKMTGSIVETAPADKAMYMEFVGDSITCAWGTIGTYDGAYTGQDGTYAYSYLTAKAFDADYSMTALSGQGILCGTPGVVLGYKYACYHKNSATEYDFARKADVVVINIGTNDFSKSSTLGITATSFYNAFKNYVSYVREKNGDNCIILAVYNTMNDTYGSEIVRVFDDLGGSAKGYYTKSLPRNTNTNNTHPSIKDNVGYAETVVNLIKSIKDGTYKETTFVSKLPNKNSVVVAEAFSGVASGTKKTFTIDGVSYEVTVGSDAFASLSEGYGKITKGGTIYLGEGTYSENVQLTKDVTIMGPKAGINPNVRGANKEDNWTLNPLRGTGEAKITGQLGMGVWNGTIYPDCHEVVIDGVMLTGGTLMRANTGGAGYGTFTFKNIYIADITQTNYVMYFFPYYPRTDNPNLYKNTLVFESVRVEGLNKNRALINPSLEKLTVKDFYMSDTCTVPLLEVASYTDGSIKSGVEYSITDSMFRNNANVLNLSAMTTTNALCAGIGNKEYIKFNVENNVFAAGSSADMIKVAFNTANSTATIKGNTFVKVDGFTGKCISDLSSAVADYSSRISITDNTFINLSDSINITKSSAPVVMSGNTEITK